MANFSSAIEIINDINDNGEWTVNVIGTVAENNITLSDISASKLTVEGVSGGTFDGQNAGRVLIIGTTIPVTLKNITIKNGKSSSNGAGIFITGASAEATLDGCVVTNNSVENASGAGICVAYSSGSTAGTKLTLNNTEVSSNTITHNNYVVSYGGGGIMIENSNVELTITGTSVIKDNKIDCSSRSGNNEEPEGAGLWLGNSATTNIDNTVYIKDNSFDLTSGGVSCGGGIFIKGGTLNVQESVFTSNTATKGSKIYIGPQFNVTYNSSTYSSNREIN